MAFFIPALMAAGTALVTTAKLGGAMALGAGGLASGVGRTLGAAASLASTATRVAGGTIGAATGLVKGVGSAVGVDSEPADQSTSDDQGAKALPPGVKLNKNGVMVQDRGAKGGGQVLPGQFDDGGNLMSLDDRLGSMEAPDRGDAGPVQQILDYVKVIAANTARTSAGVGMMASSMSFGSSQSNIDDEKGGGGMTGESGGGILSKAFGSVGKTLKAVGTSLGKTLKFGIKGLAIGGALYLFISKRKEIEKAIGGIFKYFHELYLTIKESDDPIGEIFAEIKKQFKKLGDSMLTMFETFYKETIEPMLDKMFNFLRVKVEDFIDDALSFVFGGNKQKKMTEYSKTLTSTNNTLTNLQNQLIEENGTGDLGFIGRKGIRGIETSGGQEMDDSMRAKVTRAAKNRWKALYEYSRESGYAVQWTGLPFMSDGLTGWKALTPSSDALNQTNDLAIDAVMKTQPIINGTIRPMAYLDGFVLDKELGITEGMDEIDIQGIRDNAEEATMVRWKQQNSNELFRIGPVAFSTKNQSGPSDFIIDSEQQADEKIKKLKQQSIDIYDAKLPDPDKQDAANDAMTTEGSIFTHDTHLEKLLTPVAEAFSKGANAPIIMDNSSNSSSVVKQGDTIQMPLGIHTTDPTAHAFHEWKYA